MADVFKRAVRSRIMAAIRGRGNKATELALARLFRERSITGWRRHVAMAGRPDFVFAKERVVIFVDGCFWHGCARHCRMPGSNQEYWKGKIERNVRRDLFTRAALRKAGWKVIRVWEHELKAAPGRSVARIERVLDSAAARASMRLPS